MALREIYIIALIIFFLVFSSLYVAIGNTLTDYNIDNLPDLAYRDYDNPLANDDQRGLFHYIIKGIDGYNDTDLAWINYFFVILSTLIITMIIMLLVHG